MACFGTHFACSEVMNAVKDMIDRIEGWARLRTGLIAGVLIILNLSVVWSGTIQVQSCVVEAGDYELILSKMNRYQIKLDGFGKLTRPGYASLPTRIIRIPLPDGADEIQVDIRSSAEKPIRLEFPIELSPTFLANDETHQSHCVVEYENNRHQFLSSHLLYPSKHAEVLGIDRVNPTTSVQIRYTPFRYNPQTQTLVLVSNIEITVHYTQPVQKSSSVGFKKADPDSTFLLILGSESAKTSLDDFISWKSCLGYRVQFVSIESNESCTQSSSLPEQIRCLIGHLGATHVLLLGDAETIPFVSFYPDPNNHHATGAVPSDFYYAQPTQNWDSDTDGFPGEFGDDTIGWQPDVHVARIPWSQPEVIHDILTRIISHERRPRFSEKRGLLLGAISNFRLESNSPSYFADTDGAHLMESLKNHVFGAGQSTTFYEKEGFFPSALACDAPLNRTNLLNAWMSGNYDYLTWWSHGSYQSISRKWWQSDDGDSIPERSEIQSAKLLTLQDIPSTTTDGPIIFANACENGWPEKESIGRTLLRQNCVGIVSASRLSWAILGWDEVADGGNASLTHLFWESLIKHNQDLGAALTQSKLDYLSRFSDAWQHLHNVYTYNLYGDPTLKHQTPKPVFGILKGTVENQSSPSPVRLREKGICVQTNAEGEFDFGLILPGSYTLIFENLDGQSLSTPVDVIAGVEHIVKLEQTTTGVMNASRETGALTRLQNYPNPFNSKTQIELELRQSAYVQLRIFNALGRTVRLLNSTPLAAGTFRFTWDGNNELGQSVSSGIYLCEALIDDSRLVTRVMLQK